MPTSCMTASFFYFISLSYNLLTLIYNSFLSQVYCKVSALAGREYAGQEQYLIRRLNSGLPLRIALILKNRFGVLRQQFEHTYIFSTNKTKRMLSLLVYF